MATAAPSLSKREWQVVAIALREADQHGCGGIVPPSRIGRIWTAITGREPIRPLADPRLETLRRFVCQLHRRAEPVETLGQALIDLGYSRDQVNAIAALDRP